MAITYVGGQVNGRAGSTSTSNVTFALTGGTNSTPQAGDLVIIGVTVASQARTPACAVSGYTAQTQVNANGTTYDTSMNVSYKWMGGTPDTTFTLPATGNIADAQRYTVQVWRGVDTGTPLDVAMVPASGTATGRPNPGSITPTTSGAYVGIIGAAAAGTGAAFTAPANYTTNFLTGTTSDTNDAMIGSGYRAWTSGAEDPDAYTGGTANAADSWAAFTYALRPAPVVVDGTLAVTESNDTLSSAANVPLSATFSVTESGDTVSASGTISGGNEWKVTWAELEVPEATGGGSVSATLSVTESNDTASASATVALSATLAKTEAADTLSSTVTVPISAASSLTDSADTISSAASVIVSATVANQDSPDTIAASGAVTIGATLAKIEDADTVSSVAAVAIAATLAVTETADTVSAAANVPLSATFAISETGDSLASAATVSIAASLSVTESADTLSASGIIIDGVNASLSITESADTLSAAASVPLSAGLSYTEAADGLSGSAAVTINATATLTETGDSVSGVSVLSITASASIAESSDSLSASGTVESGLVATLNVSEASDTLVAVANAAIAATLSATESGDELAAQAASAISAALDAVEAGDTVVSSVGITVTCSASMSEDGDTLTATASIISDSNSITAASMIRLAEIWARMELDAANPLATSATKLTVGTISQDISTGGAVRTGSAMVPTIDPDTMISEVWQRLGLDPDNALTQTNTSIDVGSIHLTISGTDTLTVQRV